ncbi:cytochrome c oxidase assembly protein COX11, mitochondrial [Brassica rapa]|uniref:Cytochrome c oxidase assembly protein CtaG n=1 Tax=Brassica campestris TaxID=3711 RepID=M4ENY1_BRACM|nr:cytochrome c oxidase assembly protein COX11, mitochondrial [Brassica rapa]XP_013695254.1 cytochrome c oxidase assembly protein COX11, mitochondrial [Brassica napus]XP_048627084.1 cytochrome c oxidase assembly protein COX11, mitochondrial-like [Brassica napus]
MSWSKACRGTRFSSYLENIHRTSRTVPLVPCSRYGAFNGNHHNLPSKRELWGSSSSFSHSKSMLLGGGAHRQYSTHSITETKSKKMLYYLTAVVFGMVGLTYAAVPLYRTFCQATGYGGTVQRKETVEEKIARHSDSGTVTEREIVVQFNADVADGMQWKFTPTQREVRVKPGESALAFYTAENKSSAPITGVSTYNVTPMKAGVYFNKIQCFCFEEQRLLPGEQIDMPVFFYIDPEFETDSRMDGINNLILSYTFFKVSEETTSTDSVDNKSSVPVQETN